MSYVRTVLLSTEKVILIGKLHWVIYVRAISWFALATVLCALEYHYWGNLIALKVLAVVFYGLALRAFLRAWFRRWITEFAVTDMRVIYKTGFISRRTVEMNMDKIESVDVVQSILGRLLDYGTIHVHGTGEGIEHLHHIASPIKLRNAITRNEHLQPSIRRAA